MGLLNLWKNGLKPYENPAISSNTGVYKGEQKSKICYAPARINDLQIFESKGVISSSIYP
jgi:hypothetical protein